MTLAEWVLAGSALIGIGVGGVAAWAADWAVAPLEGLLGRWRSQRVRLANVERRALHSAAPLPPRLLYGLGTFNWTVLAIAASVAGLALTEFTFSPMLPVVRASGVLAGLAPLAIRRLRVSQARRRLLVEIRRLLADLAVALRYEGSPGNAVALVAGRESPGLAYRRLRVLAAAHLHGPGGAETVLARLSDDLRVPELSRLVRRLAAARQGGLSFDQAMAAALQEIIDESETTADAEVEAAPDQLHLPMLVMLLAPILILVIYPVAFFVLDQLAAVDTAALR